MWGPSPLGFPQCMASLCHRIERLPYHALLIDAQYVAQSKPVVLVCRLHNVSSVILPQCYPLVAAVHLCHTQCVQSSQIALLQEYRLHNVLCYVAGIPLSSPCAVFYCRNATVFTMFCCRYATVFTVFCVLLQVCHCLHHVPRIFIGPRQGCVSYNCNDLSRTVQRTYQGKTHRHFLVS